MEQINDKKPYDLEERTAWYAERVRNFCLKLPKMWLKVNIYHNYCAQVVRPVQIIGYLIFGCLRFELWYLFFGSCKLRFVI